MPSMMMALLGTRPFVLLRQLALMGLGGGALFVAASFGAGAMPAALAGGIAGPALLYVALLGVSFLCWRGWMQLSAQRAVTDMVGRVEQLVGENRLLDFQVRMQARVAASEGAHKLEREVNQRDQRIQRMQYEGKIAELRQQSTLEGLHRELEYYKREHARIAEENRWLKASLRQNHIDLAYLKEHVDRHVTGARPTLLARARSLFTLSSPSPGLVKLVQQLDGSAAPGGSTCSGSGS